MEPSVEMGLIVSLNYSGPGIAFTLCSFVVNSARRFILCLVLVCVFFFVVVVLLLLFFFSALLALRSPRLGKRELVCVLFVRLFVLRVLVYVSFLFLLVSGIGYDLGLWHSLVVSFYLFFILELFKMSYFSKIKKGGRVHTGWEVYQVNSNDDPGLAFDFFTTVSFIHQYISMAIMLKVFSQNVLKTTGTEDLQKKHHAS